MYLLSLIIFLPFSLGKISHDINTHTDNSIYFYNHSGIHYNCENTEFNLLSNEQSILGNVSVSNNEDYLFLTYNVNSTKLHIESVFIRINGTRDNPVTFQKSVKNMHRYVYRVPLNEIPAFDTFNLDSEVFLASSNSENSSSVQAKTSSTGTEQTDVSQSITYTLNSCINNSQTNNYQVRRGSRW